MGRGENPVFEIIHSLNKQELALVPSSPTAFSHAATGRCHQTRRCSMSGFWKKFCRILSFVDTIKIPPGSFHLGHLRKDSGAPDAPGKT